MAVGRWVGPMLPPPPQRGAPGLSSVPVRPPVRSVCPLSWPCPKFWLRRMMGGWNISEVHSAVGDAIARASFR
eukprot:1634102-Pleurochrysis_carterae.AAC.2